MLNLSDRLADRVKIVPPSGIRRFFEIAATMEEVITLGIGEPDFVSPSPILKAAELSMEKGMTGYTSNAGIAPLRDAISEQIQKQYGVTYNPANEILVTVGASEAIQLAMLALLNPGD
jgi:aminotransferase